MVTKKYNQFLFLKLLVQMWCPWSLEPVWIGWGEGKSANTTNGSIESFNKHNGKLFPRHHPSLLEWVDTTLHWAKRWCVVLKNQMNSETFVKVYPVADIKVVPKSYKLFKPPVKKRAYNVRKITRAKKSKIDNFVSNLWTLLKVMWRCSECMWWEMVGPD